MVTESTNAFTHFYLYAKGHYQRSDTISDLRKVMGHSYSLHNEGVTIGNLLDALLPLAFEEMQRDGDWDYNLVSFFHDLHPDNTFQVLSQGDASGMPYAYRLIEVCLSRLRLARVAGLNLGEPDGDILPLA